MHVSIYLLTNEVEWKRKESWIVTHLYLDLGLSDFLLAPSTGSESLGLSQLGLDVLLSVY